MIGAGFGRGLALAAWARVLRHLGFEAMSPSWPNIGHRAQRQTPPVAPAAPVKVRAAAHRCHAHGCFVRCKPEFLMCARHWHMVPPELQRAVWRNYRVGQCDDKQPSREWLVTADAAIAAVRQLEEKVAARRAVMTSAGISPASEPKGDRPRDQHQLELVDVAPW